MKRGALRSSRLENVLVEHADVGMKRRREPEETTCTAMTPHTRRAANNLDDVEGEDLTGVGDPLAVIRVLKRRLARFARDADGSASSTEQVRELQLENARLKSLMASTAVTPVSSFHMEVEKLQQSLAKAHASAREQDQEWACERLELTSQAERAEDAAVRAKSAVESALEHVQRLQAE
jgi:hypothetical protein